MSKIYAQVRMTIVRQVEFEADSTQPLKELEDLAKRQALAEYGEYNDIEVEDMDLAPLRKEEGG